MTPEPRLSARIRAITGDATDDGWGLHYRACALRDTGHDVAMLSIGDHDFPTDPGIVAACEAALAQGRHHYSDRMGEAGLRAAVAERVAARTGVATEAANVLVTLGAQGALMAAFMTALDPGDEAILIEPAYATYAQTVRAAGGVAVPVAARPEDGFQPRAEAIEAAVTPRTRAILVNSPNNPTGAVYSRETLEGVAALAEAHDLWVVSDEVYETMVWEGAPLSIRSLPGMAARTMVAGSASKSHGMTGWRMGWLVAPEAAADAGADYMLAASYGLPPFLQDATAQALREGGEIEQGIAATYRARRAAALDALADAAPLRVVPPEGGMVVLLDVRAVSASGEVFAQRLLDAQRIALMPGESFGAAAAGHVRVSLCLPEQPLAEACRRLVAFARHQEAA